MAKKLKYSLFHKFIKICFCILFLISITLYIKPFVTSKYYSNTDFQSVRYQSLGILNPKDDSIYDASNPRQLFMSYYYDSLQLWLGFHRHYYDLLNSISKESIAINDSGEKAEILNIDKILVALLETDFTWNDVPTNPETDSLTLALGDENKHTFYLAKKPNGSWYFTEENFSNEEINNKFRTFLKEKKATSDNLHDTSMPVLSYMNFVFSANNLYGYDSKNALNSLDTSWIPVEIREQYSSFIIYTVNDLLLYSGISTSSVPGGVRPGTNLVMLYMSPIDKNISLYLEYIKSSSSNNYQWVIPQKAQENSINSFLSTSDETSPRDPLTYNIKHSLWDNIPSLINSYGTKIYVVMITVISFMLLVVIYKLTKALSNMLFIGLGKIYRNPDFKGFNKLSIAISMALAIYIAMFFLLNSMIIFLKPYFYIDFAYRVIYGITIMFLFTESINVFFSFVTSVYKQTKNEVRSARFSFRITIVNKVINLLVILVSAGVIVQELGVDMVHFLTALGIGGLAIALAGKDTIENLFGSIILAIERPIKIGDWVVIENKEGNVEKIGLRSTTIRTFEDSALIIPNYAFITSKINNMGDRTYRRYKTMLEIDETTATETLHDYIKQLHNLVQNTPYMRKEGYYITINEIATDSVNILIYVFFMSKDWGEELRQRELFITEVLNIARDMGVKFAPTQKIQFESAHN
ncbi:mechanosensitive ion channel family protein [Francisella philomiragia]|uniref:mechanosensitive ion channel family protein n=1 Tax=Francisella philomiragia TaxID=28110 RepID=UPI00351597B2